MFVFRRYLIKAIIFGRANVEDVPFSLLAAIAANDDAMFGLTRRVSDITPHLDVFCYFFSTVSGGLNYCLDV